MLAELGCAELLAALAGHRGGCLQGRGKLSVGADGGQSEVTGTLDWIVEDRCQAPMRAPSLEGPRRVIDSPGEQRVREGKLSARRREDSGLDRRLDGLGIDFKRFEGRDPETAVRRHEQEGLRSRRVEAAEAISEEPFDARRHVCRSRGDPLTVAGHGRGQLHGIEGVPARRFVDSQQGRSRGADSQSLAKQHGDRADAQGTDVQTPDLRR